MELKALTQRQISADRRRGFTVDFENDTERLDQLEKDLIGLIGEVGEFANLLKKVRLEHTLPKYEGPSLKEASAEMRDELADIAIYLIRLSTFIGGDLGADIVNKMNKNDQRYADLE